jgi:hypothetical protein
MIPETEVMVMKIHNVRAGFATNSSSSHSIVMLAPGHHVTTDEHSRFEYGWENFTLSDPASKTAYLAVQLRRALERSEIPSHTAVQHYEHILNDLEIPHVLITNQEGAFSWYVDAVTQSQGPSSYMPEHMMPFKTDDLTMEIGQAFQAWK